MGFIAPLIPMAVSAISGAAASVGAAAAASGAGMALTAGSAVLGAGASLYGGVAAEKAANYQKKVAYMATDIDRQRRAGALQAGSEAESRIKMKGTKLIGAQKAGYGASGVDISGGSPGALAAATQLEVDADAATTHYNALNEAYGYSIEEFNHMAEGNMAKAEGKNALVKGVLGAASSLMGGAASLGKQWSAMQSAGVGAAPPLPAGTFGRVPPFMGS